MTNTWTATLEVRRHASDDIRYDCGRACAQMVISSLTQGVLSGMAPTPLQMAAPVPVAQDILRQREANQVDVDGFWFTDPDEMLALMQTAPELIAINLTNWRLAHCATKDDLLIEVLASLKLGMPAILNIRTSDHWVVVKSLDEDNGLVTLLNMLDPVVRTPQPYAHTYVDACASDGNGFHEVWSLPDSAFGNYSLEIGSIMPNTYEGQYVAIVYGPSAHHGSLHDLVNKARTAMIHSNIPVVGPGPASILKDLTRWYTAYRLLDLHRLLDPPPNFNIREVKDIEGSDATYALVSAFNEHQKLGFIGVFTPDHQRLVHFRFTNDRVLIDSLTMFPGEALWWTRQDVAGLRSPYFTFRKELVNLVPKYTRLVDDYVIPSNLPPSDHTRRLTRR